MQIVGITPHGWDGLDSSLGHQNSVVDSNHLVSSAASSYALPHFSGAPVTPSVPASPASTLVGSSTDLEINLIWDASVRNSTNWSAIEAAVVAAAQIYTNDFSNHIVINIAVGFGEIGGSKLSSSALGESESSTITTNYSNVKGALTTADAGLVSGGLMSSDALTANTPPTTAKFSVASAEAKALGLINGHSTTIDGYIGIGSSSSLYFPTKGSTIGSHQYDAVGVAAHEISEVMGRASGLDGVTSGSHNVTYTPLDLFRYTAPNVRDLTPTTGYFSATDGSGGATALNTYNIPKNGGDAADWASAGATNAVVNDAFDAFGTPGVTTSVSPTDILQEAVLGYNLTSGLPKTSTVA